MPIARFSPLKFVVLSSIILLPSIGFGWLIFAQSGGPIGLFMHKGYIFSFVLAACVPFAWFVYRIGTIAYQLVFEKGRAIWIEDQTLIFTNRRITKIKLADIESVTADVFPYLGFRIRILSIWLRNGMKRAISTGILKEGQLQIVSKLNAILDVSS